VERWVKIKDKWVYIVFAPDKTFVDGAECESSKDQYEMPQPKDPADWWKK